MPTSWLTPCWFCIMDFKVGIRGYQRDLPGNGFVMERFLLKILDTRGTKLAAHVPVEKLIITAQCHIWWFECIPDNGIASQWIHPLSHCHRPLLQNHTSRDGSWRVGRSYESFVSDLGDLGSSLVVSRVVTGPADRLAVCSVYLGSALLVPRLHCGAIEEKDNRSSRGLTKWPIENLPV